MRNIKVGIAIAALIVSATTLLVRFTGQLYPFLPIGIGFSLLVLFWIANRMNHLSKNSLFILLSVITFIGFSYRIVAMMTIPSFISFDPYWYSVQTATFLETGSIENIAGSFYSSAPLSIIMDAIITKVTGMAPIPALRLLAPILGTGTIIGVIASTRRLFGSASLVQIISAVIFVLAPFNVRFSLLPIAQSLAIPQFVTAIVLLSWWQDGIWHRIASNRKHLFATVALFPLLIALTATHKLPIVALAAIIPTTILAVSVKRGDFTHLRRISSFAAVAIIFVAFQWFILTKLGPFIISRLVGNGLESRTQSLTSPTAVTVIDGYNPLLRIILDWCGSFLLLALAGLGWVWLLKMTIDNESGHSSGPRLVALSGGMISAVIFVASLATGAFNFTRILHLGEIFFAILASAFIMLVLRKNDLGHKIGVVVLLVLLLFQSVALPPIADDPFEPRSYLKPDELEAKEFGSEHISGPIYTDSRFARHGVDPSDPVAAFSFYHYGHFRSMNPILANKFTAESPTFPDKIALRSEGGPWPFSTDGPVRLTWSPTSIASRTHNRIYSNGNVRYFLTNN